MNNFSRKLRPFSFLCFKFTLQNWLPVEYPDGAIYERRWLDQKVSCSVSYWCPSGFFTMPQSTPGGIFASFLHLRGALNLIFTRSVICVWHHSTLCRTDVRCEECSILLLLHTDSKITATFITLGFTSNALVELVKYNQSFLTAKNLCGPNCHACESFYIEFF